MNLTNLEKEMTEKIRDGKISGLESFIFEFFNSNKQKNTYSGFSGHGYIIQAGFDCYVMEHEDQIHRALLDFIQLCNKLYSYQLIYISSDCPPRPMPNILFKNKDQISPPEKINWVFQANLHFTVVPTIELNDFINNGYLTQIDLDQIEEKRARRFSQKLTLYVALISLGLSTLTSVGVAIFNYKTYSKERVVTIKNLHDPQSKPMEVLIVPSPSETPKIPTVPLTSRSSGPGR